jgi:hypothetical protein
LPPHTIITIRQVQSLSAGLTVAANPFKAYHRKTQTIIVNITNKMNLHFSCSSSSPRSRRNRPRRWDCFSPGLAGIDLVDVICCITVGSIIASFVLLDELATPPSPTRSGGGTITRPSFGIILSKVSLITCFVSKSLTSSSVFTFFKAIRLLLTSCCRCRYLICICFTFTGNWSFSGMAFAAAASVNRARVSIFTPMLMAKVHTPNAPAAFVLME